MSFWIRIRIHWPDWIKSGTEKTLVKHAANERSTMQLPLRSNCPFFFLSRLNLPPWKRRKGLDEDSILKMNDKTPKVDTNSVNNPVAKVTLKMSGNEIPVIESPGSELMRKLTLIRPKAVRWICTFSFRMRNPKLQIQGRRSINYGFQIRILPGHFCCHWKKRL